MTKLIFKSVIVGACSVVASNSVFGVVVSVDGYLISDNLLSGASDASYSESAGGWLGQDTGQTNSWGGNRRFGNQGAGTSASWAFGTLGSGTYDVYASWKNDPQGPGNVSDAQYSGTDGFSTITLDQVNGASAFSGVVINDGTNDINFASIGQVVIADGDFTLTVDDSVNGNTASTFIFADAIAIRPVPEPSSALLVALAGVGMVSRRRRVA